MFGRKNYLQELRSFEAGEMPVSIPKGSLVLRIVFVCAVAVVAVVLFYHVISILSTVMPTVSPEALEVYFSS